jgi:hypothetical protein
VPAKPFEYVIEPMDIVLRDFSLLGAAPASLVISATGDGGTRVALDAKVIASVPSVEAELNVNNVDIPRFAAYFSEPLNFMVERAQARLGASFKLSLIDGVPQGTIRVGEAGVAQLRLVRSGEKGAFAEADDIVLSGATVDLAARAVEVGAFDVIKPKLRATRAADGTVDLAGLLRPAPGPASVPPAAEQAAPWSAQLGALRLKDGSLRFEDRTLTTPGVVELDRLALTLENVGTDKTLKSRVDLAFRGSRGGLFGVRGGFSQTPMKADLKVDARRLDLLVAQPWVAEQLNAELLRGALTLRGDLGVQATPAGDWAVAWNGETNVEEVHVTDRANASDLLKWRSLFAGGIALKLDSRTPDLLASLSVQEVALSDYFARIIVSPQGRLNLQDIVRRKEGGTTAAPATQVAETSAPAAAAAHRLARAPRWQG